MSRDAKDVVEMNTNPEVEMPRGQRSAEITRGFDGNYEFESFDLPEASLGELVLLPALPGKGSYRGQKRASSCSPGGKNGSPRRNSLSLRMHSAGVYFFVWYLFV